MHNVELSWFEKHMRNYIQHYNAEKYWAYRENVLRFSRGTIRRLICYIQMFYIKRCDAFNNASLGTHLGFGAEFIEPPNMPHGLYGIIVSHNAHIGRNCTIFHQVTIGEGGRKHAGAPTIGDNCCIGAGAKVIGGIIVGNNVKIGANCIVTEDVPDDTTVVLGGTRYIKRHGGVVNEEKNELP